MLRCALLRFHTNTHTHAAAALWCRARSFCRSRVCVYVHECLYSKNVRKTVDRRRPGDQPIGHERLGGLFPPTGGECHGVLGDLVLVFLWRGGERCFALFPPPSTPSTRTTHASVDSLKMRVINQWNQQQQFEQPYGTSERKLCCRRCTTHKEPFQTSVKPRALNGLLVWVG